MSKLRRHDWRSHRQIDCNICGENLQSRQEISGHRKSVHQMYRKLKCRFYPDCIDDNKCLFEHEDESDSKSSENEQIVDIALQEKNVKINHVSIMK